MTGYLSETRILSMRDDKHCTRLSHSKNTFFVNINSVEIFPSYYVVQGEIRYTIIIFNLKSIW